MRFENVVLIGFLLAIFFVTYYDIDYMTRNGQSVMTNFVYEGDANKSTAVVLPVNARR